MSTPTSTARGIHAHPTLKLGRRAAVDKPALRLAEFLTGAVPEHPIADAPPPQTWPMDKNDQWGDCVVAGLDHSLQAICAQLGVPRTNWSESEILAYYQTQNPHFDPSSSAHGAGSDDDAGMVIQDFLSYLVKKGLILGFAKVNPKDDAEVQAAIYLGLAVVTGETLQVAQQNQSTWDYVPRSGVWGGHCTPLVGYSGAQNACVTWGQIINMTDAFKDHQVDEAWFIVTQAQVDHPGFRAGFDLEKFAAAYTEITQRPFPVVVPPSPGPGPTPPPTPDPPTPAGVAYTVTDDQVNAHIAALARVRLGVETPDEWLSDHLRHYFHVT